MAGRLPRCLAQPARRAAYRGCPKEGQDIRRSFMRTIGTMRALDERRGAIHVEDAYDTDIEDLWEACTKPERLARWIAEVSGELRVDGIFHASFTSSWSGPGRVDVCEPPRHLLLTMEAGTDDETQIEAWLTREGDEDSPRCRGARTTARSAALPRRRLAGAPRGPCAFAGGRAIRLGSAMERVDAGIPGNGAHRSIAQELPTPASGRPRACFMSGVADAFLGLVGLPSP